MRRVSSEAKAFNVWRERTYGKGFSRKVLKMFGDSLNGITLMWTNSKSGLRGSLKSVKRFTMTSQIK